MPGTTRKLLTFICEARLEPRLASDLMRLGAHDYTITEARGRGKRGVRDAAWDTAANIRMEVVCEERIAQQIAEHLQKHYYDNFAMILFSVDVEVLRPEKFQMSFAEVRKDKTNAFLMNPRMERKQRRYRPTRRTRPQPDRTTGWNN